MAKSTFTFMNKIIMESPIKDRTVIDMCETAKVYSKIVHDLLPPHGVGKRKVISSSDQINPCLLLGSSLLT